MKNLFLAFIMTFGLAFSTMATPDVVTKKEAKIVVVKKKGSCTASATTIQGGHPMTVSATAATCSEAIKMLLEVL